MATTENPPPISAANAGDGSRPPAWLGYAWALAAAAAATLFAAPLASHLDLANIVMIYLLAVVVIAFRFGKGPAAAAAIVNVAAFDFFFVPPRFSFAVADAQYLLTFAVMLSTGLVIAQLAARLKQQAAAATLREVWGPSYSEQTHYVRVVMQHLRQKLEDDAAQPAFLLTEIGVGYRLAMP